MDHQTVLVPGNPWQNGLLPEQSYDSCQTFGSPVLSPGRIHSMPPTDTWQVHLADHSQIKTPGQQTFLQFHPTILLSVSEIPETPRTVVCLSCYHCASPDSDLPVQYVNQAEHISHIYHINPVNRSDR